MQPKKYTALASLEYDMWVEFTDDDIPEGTTPLRYAQQLEYSKWQEGVDVELKVYAISEHD